MKKITSFMFMAIAMIAALTSCVEKPYVNDQYVGDVKTFVYQPSLFQVTSYTFNPFTDQGTITVSNGYTTKTTDVDCLTPNKVGDAIILEVPVMPESMQWNQADYQYLPVGSRWNTKYGFGPSLATVTFIEKSIYGTYSLKRDKAVSWTYPPNSASWTSSFRGLSGISSIVMPKKGLIGYGVNPSQLFFSLP